MKLHLANSDNFMINMAFSGFLREITQDQQFAAKEKLVSSFLLRLKKRKLHL